MGPTFTKLQKRKVPSPLVSSRDTIRWPYESTVPSITAELPINIESNKWINNKELPMKMDAINKRIKSCTSE